MPSVAELLERESTTVDLERGQFERLLRRRDRKRRNQRIGAAALAIILALVSFVALARAFSIVERPADESPTPTDTALRRDGEIIMYTGNDPRGPGDLAAQDPNTGDVRTLVAAGAQGPIRRSHRQRRLVRRREMGRVRGRGVRRRCYRQDRDRRALGHERAG